MSDDDRLADYVRRQQDATYQRTVPDTCTCGALPLACRAQRYINGADATCCPECSHVPRHQPRRPT